MEVNSSYKHIHPEFKLNGIAYGREVLKEVAYSLIKEGEAYETYIGNFLLDWLNKKSTIEVMTSGSTGTPKAIHLQKQQMVHSAVATGNYFNLQAGNKALLCLPVEYIAGKMMLVRAMVLGLEIDYVPSSSYPLAQIEKKYDFSAMVPMQLGNSIDKIEQVRTLIVGGAPLSQHLRRQVENKSIRVYETYGMTETSTHVAVREIDTDSGSGSISFSALPNVHFTKDHRGCLIIDAPMISSEPVVTNDMIHLISETEFEWLGRYDNVINSGGVKLFPEQIEQKLAPFMDNPFFVAGIPDQELGQQLVLVIEGRSDSENTLGHLKKISALNKFEIPKAIYQIPEFKRTDTGKIRRKETLQLLNI